MTTATPPDDPLTLDIRDDLQRVDSVMTRVITDPVIADEFIHDPNGVLARLGLHPRTTREVHDKVNRIFYAVLTNTELMQVLAEHFQDFDTGRDADEAVLKEALGRGRVENTLEFDLAVVEHLFLDPDVLKRVYTLTLYDLNNRRLFDNVYTTEEIDEFVDEAVRAIVERRPLRDFPELESWDDRYGIGGEKLGVFPEVGPAVTLVALAEGLAFATVVLPVLAFIDGDASVVAEDAVRGDPEAAIRVATTGALLRFAGEVLVHANNFERRRRP